MDGITPVGAEVQPPNIGQGLNTLSSILGLSQQQIAIKQQQQALAAQTAEAAQEQQKNSELQQAQQLSLSVKNGQFLNPDGTLDRQALADKLTQVGPYAEASANQVLAQANEIAQNRLAKQQLSQNVQNQLGQGLTGLASDPNTTPQDVKEWVSSQIAAHPNDPQFRDYMLSMAMHFPSQAPANVQHQILQRWAAEYTGEQIQTPTTINTGGQILPGATNRFSGQFMPSGQAPIQTTMPPQFVSGPSGVPQPEGGAYGTGSPTGGVTTGPVPTAADWTAFNGYQQNLNTRVQMASTSIPQLEMADNALNVIRAGAGTQTRANWAYRLQAIGAPKELVNAVANGSLADVQLAEKYLFQSAMGALMQSGGAGTNEQVQRAMTILPNVGTDPKATHELLQFLTDQGQSAYAEQQALLKARQDRTFNPATWQANWQQQLRSGKAAGVPASQVPHGTLPTASQTAARRVVRTGTYQGKKVVQYSDGSIDYAGD